MILTAITVGIQEPNMVKLTPVAVFNFLRQVKIVKKHENKTGQQFFSTCSVSSLTE